MRGALVHYGYWAVAAALLLENAGVPLPGETEAYHAIMIQWRRIVEWAILVVDRGNFPLVNFESPDGEVHDWFPPVAAMKPGNSHDCK